MRSSEIQGQLWGQAAEDWANIQEPMNSPLWQAMLDATGVGPQTALFDAGCGGGGTAILAAKRQAHISGLDASEQLIQLASQRVPSGDFRVGNLEDLPFEDNAFDVVFAANSLQYTTNRVAALREMRRVCKSDGRIIIGLIGMPDQFEARKVFMAMAEALPEPPLGAGPFELAMPGKLEALLSAASLNIIAQNDVNCPFYYDDFETFWRGTISLGPAQGMLKVVSEGTLKNALHNVGTEFVREDGSIYIGPNIYQYVTTAP